MENPPAFKAGDNIETDYDGVVHKAKVIKVEPSDYISLDMLGDYYCWEYTVIEDCEKLEVIQGVGKMGWEISKDK